MTLLSTQSEHNFPLPHESAHDSHGAPSAYSEDLQAFSADPHERYHVIHKEFQEQLAENISNEQPLLSPSVKNARSSVSSTRLRQQNRWQTPNDGHVDTSYASDRQLLEEMPPISTQHRSEPKDINLADDLLKRQIVPESREKPWHTFMNRYEDTPEYAIEILEGFPIYYQAKVVVKHDKIIKSSTASTKPAPPAQASSAIPPMARQNSNTGISNLKPENRVIPDRIRINSPLILSVLSQLDSRFDPTEPAVMLRPYKFLVLYEKRIQTEFDDICRRKDRKSGPENIEDLYRHMLVLMDFMDTYLRPTLRRLRDNATRTINFRDLWYIYQPGVDLWMPLRILHAQVATDRADATPEVFRDRYQILWRISGTGGGRPRICDSRKEETEGSLAVNAFAINAYYIDFDGKYFLPTHHTYFIQPFEGEKEITKLDYFPARFLNDGEAKIQEHVINGKQTFQAITEGQMHFYYSGITMTTHPCGCRIGDSPVHQEIVDSEVIVDTKAALLQNPSWQPQANMWKAPPTRQSELSELHQVSTWSGPEEDRMVHYGHDYIFDDNDLDMKIAMTFKENTRIFQPIPSAWMDNARMVPETDYGIFAGRVFGFVLRTRSFAPLWIWHLTQMKRQRQSLDNLQLRDNQSKHVLQMLVQSHYNQLKKNPDFEFDVIRGKCKGLIILFHGVAGTGKTSTAESIAAALGKPLFQITCGDLGVQPNEVEKALKDIFRFAQQWGCILLLDECEIFLSRRTKNDITHNALVSVFLRTLELYTGVLFLTTNRVGVLDDAIKSRLTWTSYYPPLNQAQTMKIWETHMKMLEDRRADISLNKDRILKFANRHFLQSSQKGRAWNGREIQNAFKVAVALAEEADLDSGNVDEAVNHEISPRHKPRLKASHFKTVARNTSSFHGYFRQATGYTDGERAWNAMERCDDWESESTGSDTHTNATTQKRQERGLSIPDPYFPYGDSNSPKQNGYFGRRRSSVTHDTGLSSQGLRRSSITQAPAIIKQGSHHRARAKHTTRSNSGFPNRSSAAPNEDSLEWPREAILTLTDEGDRFSDCSESDSA